MGKRSSVTIVMTSLISLVEQGDPGRLAEKLEGAKCNESFKRELNQRNKSGHTALDVAALLGRRSLLGMLLDSGVDVNASNKSGNPGL